MVTYLIPLDTRVPLGVKADRQYHTITHNPSTVKAGETLYVRARN
jgi:hypothetical protein